MEELYYNVEHPLIGVLSSMEVVGFNVNEEILESLAVKFKEEIKNTEKKFIIFVKKSLIYHHQNSLERYYLKN